MPRPIFNAILCLLALVIGTALLYGKLFGIIVILGASVSLVYADDERRKRATSRLLFFLQLPIALKSGYRAVSVFGNDFLGWGMLLFAIVCWALLITNIVIFVSTIDWKKAGGSPSNGS